MKTTQRRAVIAYSTLTAMGQRDLPTATALSLFRLRRALKEIVDFQSEQEQKLAKKLGVTISEQGVFQYPDAETRAKFAKEHDALVATECDVSADPVEVSINEIDRLSMNEIESLDGFVIFK